MTVGVYLDILKEFLMLVLEDVSDDMLFQKG
jgi:hypothetical protein